MHFSVANLDTGSIPNAPISIPNRGASSPIACRPYVDRSRHYIDRGWRVIPRAARYRSSKQCTHCQAADNAGRYVATPCNRRLGCTRQTKTACDQQTDQKLSHFGPPNERYRCNVCLRKIYGGMEAGTWLGRHRPAGDGKLSGGTTIFAESTLPKRSVSPCHRQSHD